MTDDTNRDIEKIPEAVKRLEDRLFYYAATYFHFRNVSGREKRQYQADILAKCEYLVAKGLDIPHDVARVLVPLARQGIDKRLPLPTAVKRMRDIVVEKWNRWRTEQIAHGKKSKAATFEAVDGARAELEELAKTIGPEVLLKEATLKDRVVRSKWA
jgi:hypothetical protein